MAGETPRTETPAAADGAAADLLEVAAAAEAAKPAPEGAAPQETPIESKPADDKKAGDDGAKPEAEKPAADLLADDDEGKTPDKADGQPDAKKDETPETYEAFTLPEGMKLDDAALAQATPLFREANLTQDQAQKLVSFYADMQAKAAEQQVAGFNQIKLDWQKTIKADQEFGGDKLPQTLGEAKSLLVEFGDADLRSDLKEWGWANHPGLIRMLARIRAKLSPDTLVIADAAAQSAPKAPHEVLWPGMSQQTQE